MYNYQAIAVQKQKTNLLTPSQARCRQVQMLLLKTSESLRMGESVFLENFNFKITETLVYHDLLQTGTTKHREILRN